MGNDVKRNIKSWLLSGLLLAILYGCASQISNIAEFRPVVLQKSPLMPTEAQLNGHRPKVVVFEIEDGGNVVASQAALGRSLTGDIENVLSSRAELIDRKAASKLKDEITLVEANQIDSEEGSEITGPEIADYGISGKITNAGFTHRFKEGSSWTDKKGINHYTAPTFRYTAKVSGVLKIFQIPSLKVVKTISFSDNKGRTEEARSSQQYAERDDAMVLGAGADAIQSSRIMLENFFGKRGYVVDARRKGERIIYKVTFGRNDGIQPGKECDIYSALESINQITGKKTYEQVKLCEGIVTNLVSPDTAWIEVDNGDSLLKLGDEVRGISTEEIGDALHHLGTTLNAWVE